MKSVGQEAFEEYISELEALAGCSAKIRKWEQLSMIERRAWEAAAEAVVQRIRDLSDRL